MASGEKILIVVGLAVLALYAFRYTQKLDAEARAHLGDVANDNAIAGGATDLAKGLIKVL